MLATFAAGFALLGSARAQVFVWSGSGDWSSLTNWSIGSVPGIAHTAQIASGTATVSNARSIGALVLSGGTLNGIGTLTIASTGSSWQSGTMSGSGQTLISSGSDFAVSTTSTKTLNARSLENRGSVTWSGGAIYTGNGTVVTNAAGASLTVTTDNAIYNNQGGTQAVLNNAGTLTKSTTTGTTEIQAALNNTGTVNVNSGTLLLTGGGTNSNALNIAGTLRIGSSNYTFADGTTLGGSGSLDLAGGTSTFTGNNTGSANIVVSGGTATFNGATSTSGGGTFSSGTLNGTGTLTLASPITLNGTTLTGSGTLNANAGATLANSFTLNGTRTLTLAGNSTWTGGYIYAGGGSTVTLLPNATLSTNFDGTLNGTYWGSGTATTVFNNQGTFTKTTATGTTDLYAVFNNSGTTQVDSGTLRLAVGGSSAAGSTLAIASGAALLINGDFTMAAGAQLTGLGTARVTSGIFSALGAIPVKTFTFDGGQLTGTQAFDGTINWNYGSWNASAAGATTTIANTGALNIASGSDHNFNYRQIVNNGAATWTAGYLRGGNGSVFTNNGTFTDLNASGYTMYNPGSSAGYGGTFEFVNNGSYVRNTTGTTYVDIPFTNNSAVEVRAGDLQFRAGGTLASSGRMAVASGANVYFTNGYTVQNGASLTGAGNYWLTGGTLSVNGTMSTGTFTQTGGSMAGTHAIGTGTFNWNGGNWNADTGGAATTVAAGATLTLGNGTNHDFNYRTITNNGTVTWSSGYLRGGNGSVFANNAVFDDRNASGYSAYNPGSGAGFGGTFTFENNGRYVRNVTGTTYFDVPFNNNGSVDLQQGDLQLRAGGTLATSGTMAAAAGSTVYFTNGYTINNGASLSGAGTFWLTNGSLLLNGAISVGNFVQTGGSLAGTNSINGTFTWNGGNWDAAAAGPTTTIAGGAGLSLGSGANHDFNYRVVTNNGTVTWSSGYLRGGNGSVFANNGTFEDRNASGYSAYNPGSGAGFGGTFTFANAGTYNRGVGGTTYFDTPFNNTGTINLTGGDLQLRAGGTMGATSIVNAATGTHLYFTHDYTIADGAQFAGAGAFVQTSGRLTLNGTLQASAFDWNGGDWNATASGATTIIGGTTVLNAGAGANHDFNYRVIVNNGTVNWTSGYFRGGNGSLFTNTGTFNDRNASGYSMYNPGSGSGFGGAFTFANAGTYNRDVAGTSYLDTTFNNTGTINVAAGDLQLRGGGTMGATSVVNAAAGTHVYFISNYTLLDGAQLKGAGVYQQVSGTLTIDGALNAASFTWSGGNWNAPNDSGLTTTIAAGTTLNLTAGNDGSRDFNGRTLLNNGVVNWTSAYLRGSNGSSFINNGTFNDQNSSGYIVYNPATGAFTFTNNGAYNRTTGGTTTFSVPFTNNGSLNLAGGAMNFQSSYAGTGGIALANNASAQFPAAITVNGPLSGQGTLTAAAVNAGGQVSPGVGAGRLTINGNLSLLSTSSLLIQLGGTLQEAAYDFLNVTGSATLGGGLSLAFLNNFQSAVQPGDTFTVVTASSLAGAFANVANGQRILTTDGFGSFQVNYGVNSAFANNNVVLSGFVAVPEPSTWALLGFGSLVLGWTVRRRRHR